jgi:hypothetical protein
MNTVRWDPNSPDSNLFRQSSVLYCTYHYMQIVIHRPYIFSSRRTTPLGISSTAICEGAARTISRILTVIETRVCVPMSHHLVCALVDIRLRTEADIK